MINIILDIGTLNTKAGFGAEANPRIITESFYISADMNKTQNEEEMLFAHLTAQRNFAFNLDVSRKDVQIEDIHEITYQNMQQRLGTQHCLIKAQSYCKFVANLINELREGNQIESQILLVEPANFKCHQLNQYRSILCQYLFEQLNISSVYFLKSSVANCFSQGCPGGIVIDSGQNFTSVSRIVDGYQEASSIINFGGNCLTQELQKIIQNKQLTGSFTYPTFEKFTPFNQLVKSRQYKLIKEQLFRYNQQIEYERVVTVQLPDKQTIKIDKEQMQQPLTQYIEYQKNNQLTFPYSYQGLSREVADLLEEAWEKQKINMNKDIIFTGGNFLFKDFLARSQTAIRKSCQVREIADVSFIDNQNKLQSGWIGGSIVSALPTFNSYWLTNRDWKQFGNSMINKKCA